MNKLLFIAVAFLPLLAGAQSASMLVMNDIHLDFEMNKSEFYHSDADSNLFNAAVKHTAGETFQYIILPGDFLPHQLVHAPGSMKQTFSFIVGKLQQAHKNAVIIPALGNNDCAEHNAPDARTYQIFYESMLKRIDARGTIKDDFLRGGYYEYSSEGLSVIVLNTVLFKFGSEDEAHQEILWLQRRLHADSVAGKKVWLVYHIPPGIDRHGKNNAWKPSVEREFVQTVQQYASVITFQMAGHTHMNDDKLITSGNKIVSVINITPGLDTRNGNNPGYQVMQYDVRSKKISEVRTWYTDSTHPHDWMSFSFHDFGFPFLMHFDAASAAGKEFVQHYFANRPVSTLPEDSRHSYDAQFVAQSLIPVQ